MTRWRNATLGQVCKEGGGFIRTGPFGAQLHQHDYVDDPNGIPVVMPKDMSDGRVDKSTIARVDRETADRLSEHLLEPGDVVLARRGDVGRTAWVSEDDVPALCGTGSMRIHPGDGAIDPRYLRYVMRSAEVSEFLHGHAVGATMPNLNSDIVSRLPISVPPLAHQRIFAGLLGSLDDLIENDRRRIDLLEQAARSIYREWFVRFRFPGWQSRRLIETRLGPIPDGWEVRQIGDVLELRYGKALKAADRRGGSVAVVGSSGIVGWHDQPLVDGPAVVVGRKGNVGSITWVAGPAWPIDTTYFVVSDLPLAYIREQLASTEFVNSHAAVPGLSKEDAYAKPFLVPDTGLMDRFADIWESLSGQQHALERALTTTKQLRDLLLPELVSGHIDVSRLDVDAMMEATA